MQYGVEEEAWKYLKVYIISAYMYTAILVIFY